MISYPSWIGKGMLRSSDKNGVVRLVIDTPPINLLYINLPVNILHIKNTNVTTQCPHLVAWKFWADNY